MAGWFARIVDGKAGRPDHDATFHRPSPNKELVG